MGVVVLGLEVFEFSALVEAEGVLGPLTAVFEEDKPPEKLQLDCSEVEVGTLTQHPADWLPLEELRTCCPNLTRQSSSSLLQISFLCCN